MTAKALSTLSAVLVLCLPSILLVPSVLAQEPLDSDASPDGALGAINPSYRVSDSPWLQLPEDLRDWPPMLPPEPGEIEGADVDDPTAVVVHDLATGETIEIPSHDETLGTSSPGSRSAPPYAGLLPPGIVLESVFPPDDRTRVSPTTSYPWRTVAKLYMTFPDAAQGGCSGAIIGCPDGHGYHILTAGHCVYSHSHGGWASSIRVVPGLDETYMPYNYAWATFMRSYTGWTTSGMTEHDWALVTLDRNVGDFTGWMGRMTASSSDAIYTGVLNTAGYPCNSYDAVNCPYPKTPVDTMWFDADSGRTANEYNHWYWMDTQAGQSGSPVWRYVDPSRWILTVHTTGNDGTGSNHGTRLNTDKYDRIFTWCDADTPPTDRADLIDDGQSWSGFSPTMVRPGTTSFHAWSDVRNVGTAASGGFYVSYYASSNTTISTSDFLIGSAYVPSIAAFNWADSDWTGTFPGGLGDGSYWVGWIIDRTGLVTEFDEGNNTAYKTSYQLLVDGTAPSNPTWASETHGAPNNIWQRTVSDPSFAWGGASDGSGSGVAGYYVYWGTSSSGTSGIWTSSASYDPPAVPSPSVYYLRVQTRDNVGNLAPWQTLFIFGYDGSAPTNPTSVSSPSHPVGVWSNDNTVDVSWSGASDGGGSGVYGYSYAWSTSSSTIPDTSVNTTASSATSPPLGNSSNWYFHVRTVDNVGNWNSGAAHLGPFSIDTSAPSNPTWATETHGAVSNAWQRTVSDPSFAWGGASDSGGSGVAGYYVYWGTSPSGTSGTWTTSTGYDPSAVPSPSVYYLRVQARDNAGNSASSWQTLFTFRYDASPPTGSITVNGGDTYATSTSVALTLSASDTGSGIDQMRFSNNGTSWSGWEPYAPGKSWTLTSGDGPKTVYVQYRDIAENVSSTYSDGIFLDTLAPTGSILINGGDTYASSTSVTLALSASDSGSGVAEMRFSNNGTSWGGWESYSTSKSWTLPSGDGSKDVYVQYRDHVGMVSSSYSDGIFLDTVAPSSSCASPASTIDLAFTVTWSGSDGPGSGIASYDVQYRVGSGGAWTPWLTGATDTSAIFGPDTPVPVFREVTYYFRVRAWDHAGNLEAYPGGDGDTSTYVEMVYYIYVPATLKAF